MHQKCGVRETAEEEEEMEPRTQEFDESKNKK
jgi:hypothetical protein